jgi:hypothetical protein
MHNLTSGLIDVKRVRLSTSSQTKRAEEDDVITEEDVTRGCNHEKWLTNTTGLRSQACPRRHGDSMAVARPRCPTRCRRWRSANPLRESPGRWVSKPITKTRNLIRNLTRNLQLSSELLETGMHYATTAASDLLQTIGTSCWPCWVPVQWIASINVRKHNCVRISRSRA